MKDLLPLEAYQRTGGALWLRSALATAVFALPGTYADILAGENSLGIGPTVLLSALMGLGFGTLFTGVEEYRARRLARRVHRADPAIVPAPPEGRQEYRLACSHLPDGETAVGGHLYAGPSALTFVPHRMSPRRLQAPLTLPAGPDIAVEIVEVRLGGLERLFAESPSRRLRIHGGGGACADFLTPDPDEVAEALRGYYRSTAALHPPNAPEIPRLRSGREPRG